MVFLEVRSAIRIQWTRISFLVSFLLSLPFSWKGDNEWPTSLPLAFSYSVGLFSCERVTLAHFLFVSCRLRIGFNRECWFSTSCTLCFACETLHYITWVSLSWKKIILCSHPLILLCRWVFLLRQWLESRRYYFLSYISREGCRSLLSIQNSMSLYLVLGLRSLSSFPSALQPNAWSIFIPKQLMGVSHSKSSSSLRSLSVKENLFLSWCCLSCVLTLPISSSCPHEWKRQCSLFCDDHREVYCVWL